MEKSEDDQLKTILSDIETPLLEELMTYQTNWWRQDSNQQGRINHKLHNLLDNEKIIEVNENRKSSGILSKEKVSLLFFNNIVYN